MSAPLCPSCGTVLDNHGGCWKCESLLPAPVLNQPMTSYEEAHAVQQQAWQDYMKSSEARLAAFETYCQLSKEDDRLFQVWRDAHLKACAAFDTHMGDRL